jgi:hypothetical protein
MSKASISEIKKELQSLDASTLQALCLRLAKHKKENKELLAYLLFDASDESGYIRNVKAELDELFDEIPDRNLYIVKKMLRKILRITNTYIRYSGLPQTELDLRIHFCEKVKAASIPLSSGTVLFNLYQQQLKKITTVLNKLPEDYQGDYAASLDSIRHS